MASLSEYAKHLRFTHFSLVTVSLLIVITSFLTPTTVLQKAQLQAETLLDLHEGREELSLYAEAEAEIAAAFPEYSRETMVVLSLPDGNGNIQERAFTTEFNFSIPLPVKGLPQGSDSQLSWFLTAAGKMDWATENAREGYFKEKISNLDDLARRWESFIGPDQVITAKNVDRNQPSLIYTSDQELEFPAFTVREETISATLIRDPQEINRLRASDSFSERARVSYSTTTALTARLISQIDDDIEFARSEDYTYSFGTKEEGEDAAFDLENARKTVASFEVKYPYSIVLSLTDRNGFTETYLYPVNPVQATFSARRKFLKKLNWIADETTVPLTRATEADAREVFSELYEVVGILSSLDLTDITQHINGLVKTEKGSVSLFGVKAPTTLIATWGNLVIAGIVFYLALHIRAFNRKAMEEEEEIDFPWVGFYSGGQLEAISAYGAVFLPPLLAIILPLFAGNDIEFDNWRAVTIVVAIAALIFLFFEFRRLRHLEIEPPLHNVTTPH